MVLHSYYVSTGMLLDVKKSCLTTYQMLILGHRSPQCFSNSSCSALTLWEKELTKMQERAKKLSNELDKERLACTKLEKELGQAKKIKSRSEQQQYCTGSN